MAAGAALLLGGGTYALWSDSAQLTASGNIVAGDLDITAKGSVTYFDVSWDREADQQTAIITGSSVKGHAITNLSDYRVVPGDTIAAVFPYQVKLEGDNLVAKLSVDATPSNSGFSAISYEYQVFNGSGTAASARVSTISSIGVVQAPNTGQADGVNDKIPSTSNDITVVSPPAQAADPNLYVVVYATFDATTANQTFTETSGTQGSTSIGTITVSLTQTRDKDDSAGFNK
jgi:alternate signal-mediated exported protein